MCDDVGAEGGSATQAQGPWHGAPLKSELDIGDTVLQPMDLQFTQWKPKRESTDHVPQSCGDRDITGDVTKETQCDACLSRGRRVWPPGAARAAHLAAACDAPRDAMRALRVCWECRALVDRSLLVCARVRRARAVLASRTDPNSNTSLSTMLATTKVGFDYELDSDSTHGNGDHRPDEWEITLSTDARIKEELPEHSTAGSNETGLDCRASTSSRLNSANKRADVNIKAGIELTGHSKETSVKPGKVKSSTILRGVRITLMEESERLRIQEEDRSSEAYVKSRYKCETCIVGFVKSFFLEEHNEKRHRMEIGAYACDICAVRFPLERQRRAHRAKHYQRYACSGCQFADRRFVAVKRHYSGTHELDKVFPCAQCDRVFTIYRDLDNHRVEMHMEKKQCPHCDKIFNGWRYNKHLLTHRDLELLRCDVCARACRGRDRLKAHMRRHAAPGGEDAFCGECSQQYRDRDVLRLHLLHSARHVSFANMKHACDECDRRFISTKKLQTHKDLVHLKKLFECDTCNKNYMTAKGLKAHVRKVHEGVAAPRNKLCDFCDKAFSTNDTLESHRRTHTGERPYACSICGAAFTQSGTLRTHYKFVHQMRTKVKKSTKKDRDP